MSCICQYFVNSKDLDAKSIYNLVQEKALKGKDNLGDGDICCSSGCSNVSATDLAAARAEIWILRKSLADARMSIENLESLVKTIIDKQNVMLAEMYRLKRANFELQDECRMQRDYHTMERNAMIRELHDIKQLLGRRSKDLEDTMVQNRDLLNKVEEANEKIYLLGMKYWKLKEMTAGRLSNRCEDSDQSEESAAETDGEEKSQESESDTE